MAVCHFQAINTFVSAAQATLKLLIPLAKSRRFTLEIESRDGTERSRLEGQARRFRRMSGHFQHHDKCE
jgi:hypothetical protein